VVHLIRNSMRYASWKDRKAIAATLRPIYAAPTVEAAEQALETFAGSEVGRRCPAVVDVWRRAWTEFVPFLDLPPDIRRVVYTTDENVNRPGTEDGCFWVVRLALRSCLRPRPAAAVKVERPTGRTT